MEFSADGQWLATSCRPDIVVWRTSDWTQAWTLARKDSAPPLAISPDSHFLVARYDQSEVRFLAIESGQVLASFDLPNSQPVAAMQFSPNGSHLALRGVNTADVFMIDLSNLRARLASMGLDWDRPPYPSERPAPPAAAPPLSVIIETGLPDAK